MRTRGKSIAEAICGEIKKNSHTVRTAWNSNSEEAWGEQKGPPREYGLSPDNLIATFQRNISQYCWGNTVLNVARVWLPCFDLLGFLRNVECSSSLKMVKLESTSNRSQQHGQTRAACCKQECRDILRWMSRYISLNVAILVRLYSSFWYQMFFKPKSSLKSLYLLYLRVIPQVDLASRLHTIPSLPRKKRHVKCETSCDNWVSLTVLKLKPTAHSMSKHVATGHSQTRVKCCAQLCCDRSFGALKLSEE